MKKIVVITLAIGLIWSGLSQAQFSKRGTSGAQFLKLGVGARAQAMGGAFTAVANDASALYWNPAGVARIPNNELIFAYTDWIADINHAYFGFVYNAGEIGSFGLSLTSVSMGQMEITTPEEPQGTGNFFNASDLAFGLTYSRNMTDRFSFGITLKLISESIWDMNAFGWAFDIGTMYDVGLGGLKLAMNMANFGPELHFTGAGLLTQFNAFPEAGNVAPVNVYYDTDHYALPMTFRLALGYAWDPFGDQVNVTECLEFVKTNDRAEALIVGAEASLMELFFVRFGLNTTPDDENEEGISAGAGVRLNLGSYKGRFDYAFTDFGRLQGIHRFSIGISF